MSTSPPPTPPGAPGHGSGLTSIRRHTKRMFVSEETGAWVIEFEVICPDCGDNGGPYDDQPASVQAVRGPYPDFVAARRGVVEHTGAG